MSKEIGGINTTLLLIFIVLKLVGVIDWPWLWVLSPFWIPVMFVLGCLIVYGLCYIPYAAVKKHRATKARGF